MTPDAPSVRLLVLIDNTALFPELSCEWGFSLALTLKSGATWIWDTGQSSLFLRNARLLGLDLARAKGVALSHGHYDHTGGLSALIEHGFQGQVFAHARWSARRFAVSPQGKARSIGPPDSALQALTSVSTLTTSRILDEELTMISDITRSPQAYQAVQGFYFDPEGQNPDTVPDDAALLLNTGSGPVLILGCCHSGVANTLKTVGARTGVKRLRAVVGGLHLVNAPMWAVEESIEALQAFGSPEVYAGHCTGETAFEALRRMLPGRVHPMGSGLELFF
ncbi:MAG: MBL fold metallo-hydrolase [Desulfovibrionales bacterium]